MKRILLSLLLTLTLTNVWAQGSIRKINPTTAEVVIKGGQHMYIDFYGPNIFRVFQDPKGGIIRDPEAKPDAQILVSQPRKAVSISLNGSTITTPSLTVTVNTTDGGLTIGSLNISPASFAKSSTSVTLSQQNDEHFFGGGVQNGRFSHTGKTINIVNTNNWVDGGVASPCPFFWSTAGYAVMPYTFAPGKYDFGASEKGKTILTHDTDYLDIFFMFDKGIVALLGDFYQLTGNPVLLPKFGFYEGHLNAYNRDYWTLDTTISSTDRQGKMAFEDGKYYKESQKDNGGKKESLNGEKDNYQFSARAVIDRYAAADMPLGWILPNDGYGAGYGQTGSLEGNIENLRQFGEYARSKGVDIGLWTQSDLHPKEGVEPLLQRDIIGEVRDAGVRVLKTDVAWVGAGYSFGLNGVADVAETMPYYGDNARPFIISLDGWAGTQRYAGIWTGDQTGGQWEYIRFHIPTYIGSGLSGQPNICSDMDGIFGGNNMAVNVRDFQWKTFTPMQLNMDGWGLNPKYPQALGEPATSINRWYLKLKSILMPYTYSIAHEAVDGLPMIRAMFLEEENEYTLGTRTQYQFMYGPSLLIAPIYEEGENRDYIYMPQGQWMDYFSGEVYDGGRIVNDFPTPLWKLPVFVKLGAIIPVHDATNNPGQMKPDLRCYDLYPGRGSQTFTEYDDDGKTMAYKNGECVKTLIEQSLTDEGYRLHINPAQGGYEGYEKEKSTMVLIYCSEMPKKFTLKVGGRKVRLNQVSDYTSMVSTPNSYYYGTLGDKYMKVPALMFHVAKTDVQKSDVVLEIPKMKEKAVSYGLPVIGDLDVNVDVDNDNFPHGKSALTSASTSTAYTITPSWQTVPGTDYYEIEFEGQTYTTIRDTSFTIDGLKPETDYALRLRSVKDKAASPWTDFTMQTAADPLQFAIHGARATTSCKTQGGQDTDKLFDFDETTIMHTDWNTTAVPFDLTIDLHSVNSVTHLQYLPREDAGNGTILQCSAEYSTDRKSWTPLGEFKWNRDNKAKEIRFDGNPTVRYIRLHITKALGNFGSGRQIYIFRAPGSSWYIPGDINQDGKLDENDLTSYMNYTGLRQGDADFEGYISGGDLNKNGLIDAFDISAVATELEGGVEQSDSSQLAGTVTVTADKSRYKAGDEMVLTVRGKGLKAVNAISMALPYNAEELEYVGIEPTGLQQMYNMTNNRLHTNGQKALYPTFVNLGKKPLANGDCVLMTIRFKVLKTNIGQPKLGDIIIVDTCQNWLSL